jgi:hypothetical protein
MRSRLIYRRNGALIKLTYILGLTASLMSLAALPLRAGNIVLNPSFEDGPACNATRGQCAGQTPWIFTPAASGSALTVNGGSGPGAHGAPGGGANYVRFGGVTIGSYDTVSQVLTTTPGQVYTLTFWLDTSFGHADADFRVLWDGVVQYDDPAGTDSAHQFPFTQITVLSLAGTGSDTLAFQGYNPPAADLFDLVDVEAAPEPASWVLTCIGALALAWRRRR